METQGKSVYAKLARIMGIIEGIKKAGHNDHFHYDFIRSEDVLSVVRKELANNNLALLVDMKDHDRIDGLGKYKDQTLTLVTFEFTFADGDTGETVTRTWIAEGLDGQDKGINKTATAAEKYFLMKTFLISSADDPDPDGDGGSGKKTGGRQASNNGNGAKQAEALPELTYEDAEKVVSPKGTPLVGLTVDQLTALKDSSAQNVTARMKAAAKVILEARKAAAK